MATIERGSYVRPSTPGQPFPMECAAVPIERGHAHQRGHLLMGQGPQFWQVGQDRGRQHRSNPGDTAQQVVGRAPHGTRVDRRREFGVELGALALELDQVSAKALADGRCGRAQPILLCGQPLHEVPPSGRERRQRLSLGIGKRTERRANHLGEMRQDLRIERIGFCHLAGRAREIPDLPRIDHEAWQPCGSERPHEGHFQSARCLQHDPHQRQGLEMRHYYEN